MFKIIVERECGCLKKSTMQANTEVPTKDDALMKALEMVNEMNSDFCQKHSFRLEETGDSFIIKMD